MPSEIQTGLATVFGITNDGNAITVEGYASFILDSAKSSHKFDLDAVKDENNFDRALIATNEHQELTITWTPAGLTKSDAADTAVYLQPLAKVELAHFRVDTLNGDWVYIGDGSIDLTHKDAKMSLKIRKYADATQNASLTTTAS